jgi:hypothetical protein
MTLNIKIVGFWDVMPCSFVDGCHVSNELSASTLRGGRVFCPEYKGIIFL